MSDIQHSPLPVARRNRLGISAVMCVLLAAACGGNRGKDPGAASTIDPLQDVGKGVEALRSDLEASVLENYSHLTLGNIDAYRDGIARDRVVALIGVRPSDLAVGVDPPGAGRDRSLYRDRDVSLYSKNLEVHLSEDASVGWVVDEISCRVPYQGREAALPLRYTAVFIREADRWVMVSEHVSYALPEEEITELARAGRLPRLRKLGNRVPTGQASGQVESIVRKLGSAGAGYRKRVLSAGGAAVMFLPDPEQEYRGGAILEARELASFLGSAGRLSITGLVVGISDTKRVAWVTAHYSLSTTISDDVVDVPLRGTYVLERIDPAGWEIVQTHISVPVSRSVINARVFGEIKLGDNDK